MIVSTIQNGFLVKPGCYEVDIYCADIEAVLIETRKWCEKELKERS